MCDPAVAVDREFLRAVREGLSQAPKRLPCKYLYDREGSRLFDEICELPEYYPTRCETEIMREHASDIAAAIGSQLPLGSPLRLVELGSGNSAKTRWLLQSLPRPLTYIPVDISADPLMQAARELEAEFPDCDVRPLAADFTRPLRLPAPDRRQGNTPAPATIVYFPGSTIGNFEIDQARELLAQMAGLVADGPGGLLIGFDLQKDRRVLLSAYDDPRGVTARFNRNLLHRINTELGGDFNVDRFEHQARYNETHHRIEMHLVSTIEQRVCVGEDCFGFAAGESIHTENSHKYSEEGFAALARPAGWVPRRTWTDQRGYFAVMLCDFVGPSRCLP